jgi:hypothetical protein
MLTGDCFLSPASIIISLPVAGHDSTACCRDSDEPLERARRPLVWQSKSALCYPCQL